MEKGVIGIKISIWQELFNPVENIGEQSAVRGNRAAGSTGATPEEVLPAKCVRGFWQSMTALVLLLLVLLPQTVTAAPPVPQENSFSTSVQVGDPTMM